MWQPNNTANRHESRGEALGTTAGTAAANTVANTKGIWADLGSVTSFAYEAITVCVHFDPDAGPAVASFMLDIGISDGSNRFVLASNLHCAFSRQIREPGVQLYLPIHVPAGVQLSARVASSQTAEQLRLVVVGHATGLGGAPGFSRCVALFTPASSRGIAIDPGASANTKGSWTQLTSSCPADLGAMFGLIGYNGDIARAAAARTYVDIGIGASGFESIVYPNAFYSWGTVKDGPTNCPRLPVFAAAVPSTTRIVARSASSITTAGDRTIDLSLYGLVV